jgi:hypothetical protein
VCVSCLRLSVCVLQNTVIPSHTSVWRLLSRGDITLLRCRYDILDSRVFLYVLRVDIAYLLQFDVPNIWLTMSDTETRRHEKTSAENMLTHYLFLKDEEQAI